MTIRKGEPWGERATPPAGLPTASSDAQAAELVRSGCREFRLTGGDMWRTLGGSARTVDPHDAIDEGTVVPLDHLSVDWIRDGARENRPVFAHIVVTLRNPRNGFRRGDVCYVMNAQYLGSADVVPRSHPNDGRFDVLTVEASMSRRQRWLLRRRFVTGTHLPHPSIRTESVNHSWRPGRAGTLVLDGVHVGDAEEICITIHPDSLRIWF